MLTKIWQLLPSIIKKPLYLAKGPWEQGKIIYQCKTPYSFLQVIDKKGKRYLVFKDPQKSLHLQKPELIYQSYIDLKNPEAIPPYAQYFELSWLFNPNIKNILMIGLGAGVVPRALLGKFSSVNFKTIEIDPLVVKAAQDYFMLTPHPNHEIIIADGRKYLEDTDSLTDLVIMDAFFARTIPYSLFTQEFFRQIRKVLRPMGLLAINFNGALTGRKSTLFKTVYKTLKTVFPHIYLFASKTNTPQVMQNIILFAPMESKKISLSELKHRAERLHQENKLFGNFYLCLTNLYERPINIHQAKILKDVNCPLDNSLSLYGDHN